MAVSPNREREKQDRYQANSSSRYYVKIDGDTENAVFSEVSGLQMETDVFEYVEGGNNTFVYRFPGVTKTGNVTLKRGVTRDNELFRWYVRITQGIMDLRNVTISTYSTDGQLLIAWALQGAFPVRWSGPQLSAGGVAVAVESIELAHSGVLLFDH